MQELKKFFTDKSRLNLIVTILLILIYLGFFFRPKVRQLFVLLAQGSRLKADLVATKRDWENFDSLKSQLVHLNQKKDYYERNLPSEKDLPVVLEYLSAAAQKLDLRISEIKPVGAEHLDSEQVRHTLPFSIFFKAECGYHQLGRFLSELERADRFMKISDIKLIGKPDQPGVLYVQLIIVAYVMSQG